MLPVLWPTTGSNNVTYKLLGADVSYYTGKARAYLRFKRIPFEETLATQAIYKAEILPRVGWPVIPVVITPSDETLQDTSVIIDALEEKYPETPIVPAGPKQRLVAYLLEAYGDEWLKLPAMHYRWNHCLDWILAEFGSLSAPDATPEEQLEIGRKNAGRFHGSLPLLGVHPTTEAAIEASYEAFLADFDAHLAQHPFLLGTRPSLADFGLFGALYAHLYRDPYPGELMRRTAPNVAAWVNRLREDRTNEGEFLDNDEVPDSLLPILQRWASEYGPVLRDTAQLFNTWAEENLQGSGEPVRIPRGIGQHRFTLLAGEEGEVTAERAVFPYNLWMLQRALDHFGALTAEDQAGCRQLLRSIDAADILELEFRRLNLVDFKLSA